MLLKALAKAVSLLLSAVMIFSTPLNLITGKKQQPITRAEEKCRVAFAAISDMHLRENFNLIFEGMLDLGLADMEGAEDKLDAVVFDGDLTENGKPGEWDVFADALSQYDIAKNVFVATGNHDTRGPYTDDSKEFDPVEGFKANFIKKNKEITNRDISEMYYSDIVNGCYFIVLGAEESHTWAYVSDKQIEWLSSEMEKAAATGLPIFVFFHQSINQTHGLPYSWELDKTHPPEKGGIGDQSEKVETVLKKYDNVFYISGHIHAGFKINGENSRVPYNSVEYIENNNGSKITLINLPSYMYFDFIRGGHLANGCGFVVEAYDTKVLIRARNFATGTWLTAYDVSVDLVK